MSNKTTESHQTHHSTNKAAAILVILLFCGIMPVLVWVTLPQSSAYVAVTTSSAMVEVAAAAAGLKICTSEGIVVNVPGATSAVYYQLSPDCSAKNPATTVEVLTVGFSSNQEMQTALNSAYQGYRFSRGTDLDVFVSGYNVILLRGSSTNSAVQKLADSFTTQGATKVEF